MPTHEEMAFCLCGRTATERRWLVSLGITMDKVDIWKWKGMRIMPSYEESFSCLSDLFSLPIVLASCSSLGNDDDNVVLTSTESHSNLDSFRHDRALKRPSPAQENAVATSVAFGGKSRYLTVGDTSGAICLWDLKKKTRVRHYFHSGTASLQAALDPKDTHVLSLTWSALHAFRLREGTLAASLSGTCHYTTFSTSVLENSRVAIGTKTGVVDLWDISSQSRIGSLSPHTGAVTGVAFSAVSKLLLASACIDETLIFSDTATGKTVQRMELESPASSLSFHGDGITCAVGTESGLALVYDLRQPNDPIASYQAKGRVSSLRFASDATAITARTMSRSRRATLSPDNVTTDSAEQKDELGREVQSVLNRSRDSTVASTLGRSVNEPHNVPLSASLDKVCSK